MKKYIFALEIQDSAIFKEVFGPTTALINYSRMTEHFTDIVHQVLVQDNVLSVVKTPAFGLWYVTFSPKKSALPSNIDEHIDILLASGKQLIRRRCHEECGIRAGTDIDFKLAVVPLPDGISGSDHIAGYLKKTIVAYPLEGRDRAHINREEFFKIIDKKKIEIYLQPIVSFPGGKTVGFEALSRGPKNSPVHEVSSLLSAAWHFGAVKELDKVCIAEAFKWARKLPASYWISINVTPDLMSDPDFYDFIMQKRFRSFLSRTVFELTEHVPIAATQNIIKNAAKLKKFGILLAMDDIGSGFANIETIRAIRPDIVKLCLSVIRYFGAHPGVKGEICSTIGKVASFGGRVLAEGIEQKVECDILQTCGIKFAQGYFFGRPRPARDVIAALKAG